MSLRLGSRWSDAGGGVDTSSHGASGCHRVRAVKRVTGAVVALLAVACGRSVDFVDPGAATDPGDSTRNDTTVVVRGALEVMVAIAPQDTAIATAVGLNGGTLVGAAVAARRLGQPLQEGVTDSAGVVKFQGLVTGPWVVSVVRPLTAEERTVLPPGAEDVTGFAGGAAVTVDAGGTRAPILASAGRGGSVTISELFAANPSTDGNSYNTGQYLELVNNSFETVYLDGMIVGFPYILVIESNVWSCDQGAPFREDSLGLWTRYFATIPGGGTTYPPSPWIGSTTMAATSSPGATFFRMTSSIYFTQAISQLGYFKFRGQR